MPKLRDEFGRLRVVNKICAYCQEGYIGRGFTIATPWVVAPFEFCTKDCVERFLGERDEKGGAV